MPLMGALEQLGAVQRHLQDPSSPPPLLFEYVEYTPVKKRRKPIRRWAEESSWDPDPVEEQIFVSYCRALLLEVIRRAIHDWVLYRAHAELQKKQLANHAYTWLFEEKPGHPWWRRRQREDGQLLTSFLNICEILDLDPEHVRRRARQVTPRQITTAGRPAERRRRRREESTVTEHSVETVSIEELEGSIHEGMSSTSYEVQFAVSTPGYV